MLNDNQKKALKIHCAKKGIKMGDMPKLLGIPRRTFYGLISDEDRDLREPTQKAWDKLQKLVNEELSCLT